MVPTLSRDSENKEVTKLKEDYASLFDDKKEFRTFCGYLGIPATDSKPPDLDFGNLDACAFMEAVRKAGLALPVLVQNGTAFVIGDPSDAGFLAEVSGRCGGAEKSAVMSHFIDPAVPVSITALITDVDILLVAPCVELNIPDRSGDNFFFRNHGYDLDAFQDCCRDDQEFKDVSREMKHSAMRICKALQFRGYRGSVSLDAVISGSEVRFVGMNRFDKDLPVPCRAFLQSDVKTRTKLGETLSSFKGTFGCTNKEIEECDPGISLFILPDDPDPDESAYFSEVKSLCANLDWGEREDLNDIENAIPDCIAFPENIVSIACGRIVFNPNLFPLEKNWENEVFNGNDPLRLKLELINRGVRGTAKDTHLALKTDKWTLTVKVSAEKRISALSPFSIEENSLVYRGKTVAEITSKNEIFTLETKTSRGVPFKDIGEVEDLTLRIRHCPGCEYARRGAGCRYCKYTKQDFRMCGFNLDDIVETLDAYKGVRNKGQVEFDRIVIGGGCLVDPHDKVVSGIVSTAEKVMEIFPDDKVFLACPPPTMQTDMDAYHDAGIDGIIISVEVFDPPKSKAYLPGKDRVPLSAFYYTLRHAVSVFGKDEVFSNLIAGLERPDTTREGCAQIAATGAHPVISPFRPIAGTDLQDIMPLPAEVLYDLCTSVMKDCSPPKPENNEPGNNESENDKPRNMNRFPETVVLPNPYDATEKSQEAE